MSIQMSKYRTKTVLVVGGSSGIGKHVVAALLASGYSVLSVARHASDLSHEDLTQLIFDLESDFSGLAKNLDSLLSSPVNVLIYCASSRYPKTDLFDSKNKDICSSLTVSTLALLNIHHWIISHNAKYDDKYLKSLVLSSKSARRPSPHSGFLYSLSKSAQLCTCQYLALYLREKKLGSLNIVTPDLVDTPMSREILGNDNEVFKESLSAKEVGRVIVDLATHSIDILHSSEIFINSDRSISF